MSKRKLGGETGDVSPQILTLDLIQTAANANIVSTVPLPVARFASGKGQSVVIEILQVDFIWGDIQTPTTAISMLAGLATGDPSQTTIVASLADPRLFAYASFDGIFNTAVGIHLYNRVNRVNLRDGSGRGMIVATDSIFFYIDTVGKVNPQRVLDKILYRFTTVGLAEYVGIVQSQM